MPGGFEWVAGWESKDGLEAKKKKLILIVSMYTVSTQ